MSGLVGFSDVRLVGRVAGIQEEPDAVVLLLETAGRSGAAVLRARCGRGGPLPVRGDLVALRGELGQDGIVVADDAGAAVLVAASVAERAIPVASAVSAAPVLPVSPVQEVAAAEKLPPPVPAPPPVPTPPPVATPPAVAQPSAAQAPRPASAPGSRQGLPVLQRAAPPLGRPGGSAPSLRPIPAIQPAASPAPVPAPVPPATPVRAPAAAPQAATTPSPATVAQPRPLAPRPLLRPGAAAGGAGTPARAAPLPVPLAPSPAPVTASPVAPSVAAPSAPPPASGAFMAPLPSVRRVARVEVEDHVEADDDSDAPGAQAPRAVARGDTGARPGSPAAPVPVPRGAPPPDNEEIPW